MLPPSKDIQRRRPVWEALSDLFLDTELQDVDFRHIVRTLADSGYSMSELDDILYGEVYPVCIWNMRGVAGEWAAIDIDWLQEKILNNERKPWKRWRWCQLGHWMIREDWQCVGRMLRDTAGPI